MGLKKKAREAWKRGDLQTALKLFRRLGTKHPKYFVDAVVQSATILRELGRLDEADAELDAVLQKDSASLPALMAKASVAKARRDYATALDLCSIAAHYHPGSDEPILERTALLRKLGRLDEADAEIDALLERQPDHRKGLRQRSLNAEAREPGSGRVWAQRAASVHPQDPKAFIQLADSLSKSGERQTAYALLREACEHFPDNPDLPHRLARLDWRSGRLEEAFERIRGLVDLFPHRFAIWSDLVEWAIDLGRFDEANGLLDNARFFQPKQRQAIASLRARLAMRKLDFAKAQDEIKKALELPGAGADMYERLAHYSLYALELDQSRRCLQQAIAIKRTLRGTHAEGKARIGLGIRGTWLNEFSVNPFVVEQLRKVLTLPLADQPAAFADILREEPGHTPTAILLMIRLRLNNIFQGWREEAGAPGWPVRIPRRIVQFWDSAEVPPEVSELMDSWPRVCADFEYRRFSEASARHFLKSHYHASVLRAFNKCHTVPMKADLFRLAYLFREGGVYVDADDYCRHPLDCLGRLDADLILYQETFGSLGNNFIAVVPGHPVIGDALDYTVRELLESSRSDTWFTTGPGQITRAAARQLRPVMRFNLAESGHWPRWVILDRHELLSCVSIHIRCNYHRSAKSWKYAEAQQVRLVAPRSM